MLREFDHSELLHQEFTQITPLMSEISSYLRKQKLTPQTSNRDFERLRYLDEYPTIKQLYLKYNCIHATEADVERIFSFAGRLIAFIFCFVPSCFYLSICLFVCFNHLIFWCWLGLEVEIQYPKSRNLGACNLFEMNFNVYLIVFVLFFRVILKRYDNATKPTVDV